MRRLVQILPERTCAKDLDKDHTRERCMKDLDLVDPTRRNMCYVHHGDLIDLFWRNDLDHADPIDPTRSICAKDLDPMSHPRNLCERSRSYISHPDKPVLDHADHIDPKQKQGSRPRGSYRSSFFLSKNI